MSRNGRSSSQISIDNYPEHLNPFYEDDNHKRLRFWNLKKKGSDKGRRSSFSIENLRDIWTFKSFSLKKKSSTLGINKTSESPPLLRRQLNDPCEYNSFLSTRDRYSDSGTSPLRNELNFSISRRPHRSSLQHIDATSENGSLGNAFNRNDMYRATTQSVGYLTPNFRRHHQTRLSQSSLSSTNPFESDAETNGDSISTTSRKSYRKKRRAPLPPPRSSIPNNSSPINITADKVNGNIDIKSLTTEIQQFVNIRNESLDNPDPNADLNIQNSKILISKTETNGINGMTSKERPSPIPPERRRNISSQNGTKVESVETASASFHSTIDANKNSLHIDENRNFYLDPVCAVARIDKPLSDQKIEDLSIINTKKITETPLATNDGLQHEVYKAHNLEDTTTNASKIVTENALSKTERVLNKTDEAQIEKPENSNESISGQTMTIIATENAKIIEKNEMTKSESLNNERDKTQIPKIGFTDDSLTSQRNEYPSNRSQKLVIKASLSKTESSSSEISNDPAHKSRSSSINDKSNDQVIEEGTVLKSILKNTKSPINNNLLFIEEKPDSTVHITKHKALISDNLLQASEMPSSSLPKNPQQEIVPSSLQKTAFHSQDTNINCNIANSQQVIPTFNELQNDEPRSSTPKNLESNGATGKKRSVREVIESINRSQRMLNESIAKGTKIYSTPLFVEHKSSHSNELNSSNLKSTQQLKTTNILVNTASTNEGSVDPPPNVFHKSKVNKMVCEYRESSPTTSNLDWNPLPKPKRTNNS